MNQPEPVKKTVLTARARMRINGAIQTLKECAEDLNKNDCLSLKLIIAEAEDANEIPSPTK